MGAAMHNPYKEIYFYKGEDSWEYDSITGTYNTYIPLDRDLETVYRWLKTIYPDHIITWGCKIEIDDESRGGYAAGEQE
jgi:hypothetical protein